MKFGRRIFTFSIAHTMWSLWSMPVVIIAITLLERLFIKVKTTALYNSKYAFSVFIP